MQNIALLLNNVGASQLAYYAIKRFNQLALENTHSPFIFFEEHASPCMPASFSFMYASEIWGYDGTIIATSLNTADKLRKCIGNKKRYFYVWELEWLRTQANFEQIYDIYNDPSHKIIARCKDHARLLKNNFDVEVEYIMDNLDEKVLLEL